MKALALLTLSAIAALSQPVQRTFPFTHLQTPKEIAEAATVIRSITQVSELSTDAAQHTITLRADRAQTEMAEWLLARLDRAATTPSASRLDYLAPDSLVRVLYFKHTATPRERNEMATLIRSLLELRRAFISESTGALVLRASPVEADAAQWLFEALDAPEPPAANRAHQIPGGDTLRLLLAPKTTTLEEFYKQATSIRATLQLPRLFTYSPHRVIAVRGTEEQTTRAAALLN